MSVRQPARPLRSCSIHADWSYQGILNPNCFGPQVLSRSRRAVDDVVAVGHAVDLENTSFSIVVCTNQIEKHLSNLHPLGTPGSQNTSCGRNAKFHPKTGPAAGTERTGPPASASAPAPPASGAPWPASRARRPGERWVFCPSANATQDTFFRGTAGFKGGLRSCCGPFCLCPQTHMIKEG